MLELCVDAYLRYSKLFMKRQPGVLLACRQLRLRFVQGIAKPVQGKGACQGAQKMGRLLP